jgi:hypothetical protein
LHEFAAFQRQICFCAEVFLQHPIAIFSDAADGACQNALFDAFWPKFFDFEQSLFNNKQVK